MGFFDDLFGGTGKRLAREDRAQQLERETRSQGYLDRGYETSTGYLNSALDAYRPLAALGDQYNRAGGMLMDSLGINGASGSANALSAYNASPGVAAGLEGALRKANAAGGMGGNTLAALQDRATQYYGDWQNRLGSVATLGAGVSQGAAGGVSQGYNNLSNLATGYGLNSSNLIQNVGKGVSATYGAEAQAAQSGAANLAGLGMNLLSLGAKAYGGFG